MFTVNRRRVLAIGAGSLSAMLSHHSLTGAAAAEPVKIDTFASAAAVNVVLEAALASFAAKFPGKTEILRTGKIAQITQDIIAGSAGIGNADMASTLTAVEAGADLRIIGMPYSGSSQVVVANASKVKALEDIARKGGAIAVNSFGDTNYIMLVNALANRGFDAKSINFIEIANSGDRTRALLGGRVDAVPMHVEQAAQLTAKGDFKVLIRPSDDFGNWFTASLITTSSWLKSDDNRKAVVVLLKEVLSAFRKTNSDYDWFKTQIKTFASSKDLKESDDTFLRPVWVALTQDLKVFPDSMQTLNVDEFSKMISLYRKAGALKKAIDVNALIDRSYLDAALKEMN